jgi:flagellar export protein FliJ
MKGSSFRFRLERVRGLRERKEDTAKQALVVALAHHERGELALRKVEHKLESARAAQRDAATGPTSAVDLLAHQAYLERTEAARRATSDDLKRRAVELTRRRDALASASRDRQALERLKQHRREEHDREAARQEGLVLDEIAITRFRRSAA